MAEELPGSSLVRAGVEIDAGAVAAGAVPGRQDGAGLEAAQRLRQLGEGGLGPRTPAVDRVLNVGHPRPTGPAVAALEDGEVAGRVNRQRRRGKNGAILELAEAGVRQVLVACGLVDGVVGEEAEQLGRRGRYIISTTGNKSWRRQAPA